MDRKTIIKAIGKLQPSPDTFVSPHGVNFSSIFIIPSVHKIHTVKKIKELFNDITINWEIKNNSISTDLSLSDIKEYIKENIFENIDTNNIKNLKSVIYDRKNIYLSHKIKNIALTYKNINIILTEIDLWIMDGEIAFFVYKIELPSNQDIDVNTISTLINRELRDYHLLTIDIDKNELYYNDKDKGRPLVDYFKSLTLNKTKTSFLNISVKGNESTLCANQKSISNSTYYAKMITALHINENSIKENDSYQEIAPLMDTLSESATIDLGIMEELSYLLGTTSSFDFDSEPTYIGYEGYIYPMIQENGINIWKYWSGIAMQDSLSFFSIDKGRSGIVFNSKTSIYFMYIINLFVNTRLKYLENYLIDKDFINIERVLPSVREIQIIKNHYIATEIAKKFQPNYINKKISIGLQNDVLLEEVENNLQITLELTRNNTDIVFSLAAGIATLGSMWLTNDVLIELYNKYPYPTIAGVITLSMFIVIAVSKKSLIIKFVKNTFKIIKRFIGI